MIRTVSRWTLLSCLAVPLAACSIDNPFQTPETKTPTTWQASAPAAPVWPSADWWRLFGSSQLDDFMEQARQANFDIAAAVARVRQADAQLQISGAALLPTVDASAGLTRQRDVMWKSSGGAYDKHPISNSYSATSTVSYELDFWGKNRASRDSARASAAYSRFDQQTVVMTTQASVATTYFGILSGRERARLARQNLVNAETVLAAIRDRLAAGTATALDVAQQENVVATQRATIAPLEQSWRQDINALAILVGRMPDELSVGEESLDRLSLPPVVSGLPSDLLARRPDVQAAEAELAAAHADITVARAALFPSISLTGEGGLQSLQLSKLLDHRSLLFSFSPSISLPIFQGGALEGEVALKRAQYDELLQDYRKTVVTAFSDVEDALIAVEMTARQTADDEEMVRTAQVAYDIAQVQLQGGMADITTVLDTQKSLFSAQDTLVQARLSQLEALVGLYKVLGGGWQVEGSGS